MFAIGVGTFDTLRPHQRMWQGQIEYTYAKNWVGIRPFVGLMATQKGSVYVCGGILYDLYFFNDHMVLTPSFAPGLYFKNGGKNLGFPLEFRSSIALSLRGNGGNRLGLQFYHISNASLGSRNPGEESLVLFYAFAL